MSYAGFYWRPDRQSFYVGKQRFVHAGKTDTAPSHDLAHVLIGASSRMPWLPCGSDRIIRIAEFNAVFCEVLLNLVFHSIYQSSPRPETILVQTYERSAWFVERHYAPFPLTVDASCRQFAQGIDRDALVRVSPLWFSQRWREMTDGLPTRGYRIRFDYEYMPVKDPDIRRCQELLRTQIDMLIEEHSCGRRDAAECTGPGSRSDEDLVPHDASAARSPIESGPKLRLMDVESDCTQRGCE